MNKSWFKLWLWWTRKRHPDLEQFSDESKKCFARANQIASSSGSKYLNSIHLVKAVLQTPIRESIDPDGKLVAAIEDLHANQQLSHSEGLKKAVELSIEHARIIGGKKISPLLLLHGISRIPETQGAKAMLSQGVTTQKIGLLIERH